jgi:hypothetical protein
MITISRTLTETEEAAINILVAVENERRTAYSQPATNEFGRSNASYYLKGKVLCILEYNVAHSASAVNSNKSALASEYQLTNLGYSPTTERVYFQIL